MQNLTADETRSLRCVAGMMIPASTTHNVPGADDDQIFPDIVSSIGMDMASVKQALLLLNSLAEGIFADSAPARQHSAAAAFQQAGGPALTTLTRVIVQCYYRDDRVMRSLGMEARPPFPLGFEVEPGDWSLLDAVRSRPTFYRHTP